MTTTFRALSSAIVAAAALGIACGNAGAQTTPPSQSSMADNLDNASTKVGRFVGVAIGKSAYRTSCGNVAGLTCSNSGTSYSVTAGNMFTDNVGVELSYLDLGKADRAGGNVRARGLNISAVGRLPLGDSFGLQGKVGTTYGVTRANSAAISGLSSGRDSGFGLGYGVALDANVARGLHGAVGWEQHDFHFAGQGRSMVRNLTLGLAYTF
jgi:OOP family OmpA-OmpF porin